jgi:hypothetical protein
MCQPVAVGGAGDMVDASTGVALVPTLTCWCCCSGLRQSHVVDTHSSGVAAGAGAPLMADDGRAHQRRVVATKPAVAAGVHGGSGIVHVRGGLGSSGKWRASIHTAVADASGGGMALGTYITSKMPVA